MKAESFFHVSVIELSQRADRPGSCGEPRENHWPQRTVIRFYIKKTCGGRMQSVCIYVYVGIYMFAEELEKSTYNHQNEMRLDATKAMSMSMEDTSKH